MNSNDFPTTEVPAAPLARAYLPQVSKRYTRILNLEVKVNKEAPGSARYVKDDNPPAGATPTAWDLYTEDAVTAYRRASAILV
jgi:hypothetical protein